ncbi:MAG: carbohydrate binding domain-containing protein, partial [Patescibacteria group bacterium]
NAAGGSADGLTIRNNDITPIVGGVFEVQSAIGTNLFSVNNLGTELAANGGAETSGTFGTNWTAAPVGGTITRTTTAGQYSTGQAGVQVATTATNHGVRNNLSANPVVSTTYTVSFTAKLSSGTFSALDVQYSRDGGTDLEACTSYSTQTLSTSDWTKITCTITTDGTTATNPDLIIRQTDGTARTFWIDNLSFVRNDTTTQPSNVQIGGGITGGQITLFTLDRATAPPVASGDTTYLGSMYYDTTTGRIQCYESDGWGACGSAPDNIIILTPEYAGAVLGDPGNLAGAGAIPAGVGTMSAEFCANQSSVLVVGSLCASQESRNYYKWTSPQATSQTYSIYVNYKLPSTFKTFADNNTMKLTAYRDHATDASAQLSVFRKPSSGAISQCGSTTTITSGTSTWDGTSLGGTGETSCGFTGGDYVVFKIDVTASNNKTVYVENLEFTYMNQ